MPNRPTTPTGNAFLVDMPKSDRLVANLFAEQKAREAARLQADEQLDSLLQKEIGKTRAVDRPEIISLYQQRKALSKQLLFDPRLQRDPHAYAETKTMLDQLDNDIFSKGALSAEINETTKQNVAGQRAAPTQYADDFHSRIAATMATPMSQLKNHEKYGDLTDPTKLYYQGQDTSWGELFKKAEGPQVEYRGKGVPMGEKGFQTSIPTWKIGAEPAQYKSYILGEMSKRKTGKDAETMWDAIPEAEKKSVIQAYQNAPAEKWQAWGMSKPQNLYPSNPQSKAESLASYQAMKYFLESNPTPGKPEVIDNKEAIFKAKTDAERAQFLFERAKNNEDFEWKEKKKAEIRKEFAKKSDTEKEGVLNTFYSGILEDAKKGDVKPILRKDGQEVKAWQVGDTDAFRKMLSVKNDDNHLVPPDEIRITEDGDIYSLFWKREKNKAGDYVIMKNPKTGTAALDRSKTRRVPASLAKVEIGNDLFGKKEVALSVEADDDEVPTKKKQKYDDE